MNAPRETWAGTVASIAAMFFMLCFVSLLLHGCALRDQRNVMVNIPSVKDESEVLVACPDDGSHAVVDGHCVAEGVAETSKAVPFKTPPCPSDGHHQIVNGSCVDLLGK